MENLNRCELESLNILASKLNTKKVYVLCIPYEIKDRRTGKKISDELFEIVGKYEPYEIDVATERLNKKADFLGCDIEVTDYDNIEWREVELNVDELYDKGIDVI